MATQKTEEFDNELELEPKELLAVEESVENREDVADVEEEEESFEDEGAEEVVQEIKKIKKEDISLENFNWDTYSNAPNLYSDSDRSQMEAMYDQTLSSIVENEIIEGTVIAMNKREVVINIGFKSEGVVSMNEFRYRPDLQVGDKVEVYVESSEDKKGQLILSHRMARSMRSWDRVNQALENDEIITGYIKCRTKGGMIVDVFGIEAFLPGSQIDVKPIRDYDVFVGKTTEFKIVKINHDFKNVVVSHKALIEAELEQQKAEIISKLEKGQVLEGTVKNITSYGVFIDLGGVDGLIHITDLSWGRVTHPEEVVELDQKLNVVILDFDDAKKRIALGLKQLTPHPWDALDAGLKVGDTVSGKVVVIADYGAFVEISPGVEGLIHVSEMSWSQHLRSAQEFLKVGDVVDAQILTLDREDRKMSLGIKQLKLDPWNTIDEKYAVGTKHLAKVRNFTNFGVFVEIEEGVDGLIHISDLSWTKKVKHPSEFTQIGDDIDVMVLEIDKENRRLSLGHKQLEENPWEVFESIFTVDSIHEGTVIEIFDKGAIIALPYGVEGFVTLKHLVKEDGSIAKMDEKLDFKVIEFNKTSKRIILSHSRIFEEPRKDSSGSSKRSAHDDTKLVAKKLQASIEKTTFGDISELAALRDEMSTDDKGSRKKAANASEKKPKTDKKDKPVAESEVAEIAPEPEVASDAAEAQINAGESEPAETTAESVQTEEVGDAVTEEHQAEAEEKESETNTSSQSDEE
ncbi:MAG: 30S ribosomal protein S1 [Bacteroidales bacterium]|jgi:small subunit ribosomal protein S1|nr:30S ribosomal protein S1 [Bacteroidales bacterium]